MAKATKAQRAKLDRLEFTVSDLMGEIFAAGPHNQVRFSDCRVVAPQELVARYDAASDAMAAFKFEMVNAGRAWRCRNGSFNWN
jgi:hypothetical protein